MFVELLCNPSVPSLVGGEGAEVLWLEVFNESDLNFSLTCEGSGPAAVISSVANLLAHEASIVMSIERSFCEFTIQLKITGPSQVRPDETGNGGVASR